MLSNNMHADWEDTMVGTTFGHRLIKLRILFTPCGKIVIYHVIEGEPTTYQRSGRCIPRCSTVGDMSCQMQRTMHAEATMIHDSRRKPVM